MTDPMHIDFDVEEHLRSCAQGDESDIDVGKLALTLSLESHEGVSLDRYLNHFKALSDQVRERYNTLLIAQGSDDDAGVRLAALKYAIVELQGYSVDDPHHEALEAADMMRVIDRGKGASAALALLYIDAGRKNGWLIKGVDFPGAFLCRLDYQGVRVIFDPAQDCRPLEARELRDMVKAELGVAAELSTDYFAGLGPRETVLSLTNLIKNRHIEMGDYKAALHIVERLRILMPDEYPLLFDAGVLYAKLEDNSNAIYCLSDYIDAAPSVQERHEAMLILQELDIDPDR